MYPGESIGGKVFFPLDESDNKLEFNFTINNIEFKLIYAKEIFKEENKANSYADPNLVY